MESLGKEYRTSSEDGVSLNVSYIDVLPQSKGLRINLLKMIFSHFSPIERMKMGEINKEWYYLSRDPSVWSEFLKKEFPIVLTKELNDMKAGNKAGRFIIQEQKPIENPNFNTPLILHEFNGPSLNKNRLIPSTQPIDHHFEPNNQRKKGEEEKGKRET